MADLVEDINARLIAPAVVATKVFNIISNSIPNIASSLEEESVVMIETALNVGAFLEYISSEHISGIGLMSLRAGRKEGFHPEDTNYKIDFTPGVQGIWKAFELEVNLSLIQVVRKARNIKMPDNFGIYDKTTPVETSKVMTGFDNKGNTIYKDINQKDWRNKKNKRHSFLTLGEAKHVIKVMIDNEHERFNEEIATCLGYTMPQIFMDNWNTINKIRNKATHIKPIGYDDYKTVLDKVMSVQTLDIITKIKEELCGLNQDVSS